MKSVISSAIGFIVLVVSHLVIYFVRNLKMGIIFGVSLVTLMGLGISGQWPSFEWITLEWMGALAVGYAAIVAITGVFVTAYEVRKYMAKEAAGKDTTVEVIFLRKVIYNVPGYSFRSHL